MRESRTRSTTIAQSQCNRKHATAVQIKQAIKRKRKPTNLFPLMHTIVRRTVSFCQQTSLSLLFNASVKFALSSYRYTFEDQHTVCCCRSAKFNKSAKIQKPQPTTRQQYIVGIQTPFIICRVCVVMRRIQFRISYEASRPQNCVVELWALFLSLSLLDLLTKI